MAEEPQSLKVLTGRKIKPDLADVTPSDPFQLERKGYFCVDLDWTQLNP